MNASFQAKSRPLITIPSYTMSNDRDTQLKVANYVENKITQQLGYPKPVNVEGDVFSTSRPNHVSGKACAAAQLNKAAAVPLTREVFPELPPLGEKKSAKTISTSCEQSRDSSKIVKAPVFLKITDSQGKPASLPSLPVSKCVTDAFEDDNESMTSSPSPSLRKCQAETSDSEASGCFNELRQRPKRLRHRGGRQARERRQRWEAKQAALAAVGVIPQTPASGAMSTSAASPDFTTSLKQTASSTSQDSGFTSDICTPFHRPLRPMSVDLAPDGTAVVSGSPWAAPPTSQNTLSNNSASPSTKSQPAEIQQIAQPTQSAQSAQRTSNNGRIRLIRPRAGRQVRERKERARAREAARLAEDLGNTSTQV